MTRLRRCAEVTAKPLEGRWSGETYPDAPRALLAGGAPASTRETRCEPPASARFRPDATQVQRPRLEAGAFAMKHRAKPLNRSGYSLCNDNA